MGNIRTRMATDRRTISKKDRTLQEIDEAIADLRKVLEHFTPAVQARDHADDAPAKPADVVSKTIVQICMVTSYIIDRDPPDNLKMRVNDFTIGYRIYPWVIEMLIDEGLNLIEQIVGGLDIETTEGEGDRRVSGWFALSQLALR